MKCGLLSRRILFFIFFLLAQKSCQEFEALCNANNKNNHQLQSFSFLLEQLTSQVVAMGKKRKVKNKELTQEEIWDDSALIQSWDEAVEEYKVGFPFIFLSYSRDVPFLT